MSGTRIRARVRPIALTALTALFLASGPAGAVTMYRWVDERGVTHIEDSVPPAYKAKATRIESVNYDIPEANRREAVRQAAKVASAAAAKPVPAVAARDGASRPATAGVRSGAGAAQPAQGDDDCAALQRRYDESFRCFDSAPKTINGGVNGARTPSCVAVPDPSPRCGLPKADPEWRRPP